MSPANHRRALTLVVLALTALPLAACRRADSGDSVSSDATAAASAAGTAASSPMQAPPPIEGMPSGASQPSAAGDSAAATPLGVSADMTSTGAVSETASLGPAELQSASFTLDGANYTLANGRAEDAAKFLAMGLGPWSASGDLNGDGAPDPVGVLIVSGGGSGNFNYLLAATSAAGTLKVASPYFLGDRVKINAIEVAGGQIQMDVVTHGPNDPMCCPTQNAKWTFMVVGDQVVVTSKDAPPTIAAP